MTDAAALTRALLTFPRASWEQGVASHAALDRGDAALAAMLARHGVSHAAPDGRLGALGEAASVNSGALLEATLRLGTGDDAAARAAQTQRWWLLRYAPRDDSGVLHHRLDSEEVWADSVYMIVPALVACGDIAPADMQYRMHREHLWDPATGVYRHRRDLATGELTRGARWAGASGWVAAGLARSLRLGVAAEQMRERWRRETRELLDACAAFERPDGRFHDVLDDPESFVDGTAGLMLAYAALTGAAGGWLPEAYAESGERWLAASLARVDQDGFVREVCGAPLFDRPGVSPEAQAFALMALAARERLDGTLPTT
ncbi:glycoside hydrolase family 88 protein [Demequina pelophila]|uniref:glycoside hydrolase family 88 protein n=1 Tax=Demequina pelophila TaxID=1638984 RepID=UPI0007856985|nr:glycoside hydrolase family 88 protein [Demequina pelophila]